MRTSLFSLALLLAASSVLAQDAGPSICSMDQLVRMDRCQLLALYANAAAGPIPHGYTPGRVIFKPGRPLTVAKANLVSKTLWQGKVFEDDGHMINKVFGTEAIRADVYRGVGWYDGKPSIIVDYTNSGALLARYRDEIREVAPGIYLGLTYENRCPQPVLKVFFTLDARCTVK